MPPAARVTDMHTCPMVTGVVPHVGGPILPPGAPTVLIDMLPAATVTTMATCVGPPDIIVKGSAGVMINFLPAARMGDLTAHGGVIILGAPNCIIGEVGSPSPGAGGMGGIAAGLVASGAGPLVSNASKYSTAGAAASSTQLAPAAATTPQQRLEIAQAFYAQTGWSDEKISNHLRGIDFNQPVEVVTLKKDQVVKQWIDPKQGKGNYFDGDAQPEEMGLYPASVVPRELKEFVLANDTQVLKSTAAGIKVDWVPGVPPVYSRGGATQFFALPKDGGNFVPGGSR